MFGRLKFYQKGTVQNLANERDRHAGDMMTAIPFDHYIVSGKKALKVIEETKSENAQSTPFIAGDAFSVSRMVEAYESNVEDDAQTTEDIINAAKDFDIQTWLALREAEYRKYAEEDGIEFPPRGEITGEVESQNGLIGNLETLSRAPIKKLFIGVAPVPVKESWKIFAHLRYGNWNECPAPVVQCALHKYWAEKYDITLATCAFDTVEVVVGTPASTTKEAEALAMQQYLYCNDIIDQGYESFDALAASLLGAKTWFFWWD